MLMELAVAFIATLAFAVGAIAVGIALATVPLRLVRKGGQWHVRKNARIHITSIDSTKP